MKPTLVALALTASLFGLASCASDESPATPAPSSSPSTPSEDSSSSPTDFANFTPSAEAVTILGISPEEWLISHPVSDEKLAGFYTAMAAFIGEGEGDVASLFEENEELGIGEVKIAFDDSNPRHAQLMTDIEALSIDETEYTFMLFYVRSLAERSAVDYIDKKNTYAEDKTNGSYTGRY